MDQFAASLREGELPAFKLGSILHYLWVVESDLCAQTEDCWLGGRSLYIRAIAAAAAPVREHR